MKSIFLRIILVCVGLNCIASNGQGVDYWRPPQKKLIEAGWDTPTTKYLRENIRRMEECTPYQGIRIKLEGQGEGNGQHVKTMFGKTRWQYEWFQEDVENLKNTEFKKFTDNFIATGVMPGDVDWFSDSDWSSVCNNFAVVARIALETGMKGIIFDPEEYGSYIWSGTNVSGHTRAETETKARQRGQEFGEALFQNFPEIKLFCWCAFSMVSNGSLYGPFLNGIYDVMPPTATLIDGHETKGYTANSRADYLKMRADFSLDFKRHIDKKNLVKYRTQTQLAAATYLEPYFRQYTKKSTWKEILRPGLEKYGSVDFLRRNLTMALEVSDEYAWTWNEYISWWAGTIDGWQQKAIEAIAPGATEAVLAAFDPLGYAEKTVKTYNLQNRLKNPAFEDGDKGWGFYSGRRAEGSHSPENGTMLVCGGQPNLTQQLIVRPGEQYLITARGCLETGTLSPYAIMKINVSFRESTEGTSWLIQHEIGTVLGEPDEEGVREGKLFLTVPERASRIFLALQVLNQKNDGKAYWMDAAVYLIKTPQPLCPTGANLLKNYDFKDGFTNWGLWQNSKTSNGSLKNGAIEKVTDGSIYQAVPIDTTKKYQLRAEVNAKNATLKLSGKFMGMNKKWLNAAASDVTVSFSSPDSQGNCKANLALNDIPAGAAFAACMISVSGKEDSVKPFFAELAEIIESEK